MHKSESNGLALWQFDKLPSGQKHFVSGRQGGVSEEELSSLNLSFSAGDSPENVKENRTRLAHALGLKSDDLVFISQCHSADIIVLRSEEDCKEVYRADALVTNLTNKCICVMGADCVPVVVYDPVKKVVAAIHAGWRGTSASITAKTLLLMEQMYGCKPHQMYVGIGPSISQEHYEVGKEVYEEFKHLHPDDVDQIFYYDSQKNKYFPDLWLANQLQALRIGVPQENIEIAGICTYSHPKEFFSARYFKNKTGRFSAGICLM